MSGTIEVRHALMCEAGGTSDVNHWKLRHWNENTWPKTWVRVKTNMLEFWMVLHHTQWQVMIPYPFQLLCSLPLLYIKFRRANPPIWIMQFFWQNKKGVFLQPNIIRWNTLDYIAVSVPGSLCRAFLLCRLISLSFRIFLNCERNHCLLEVLQSNSLDGKW